MTENFSELETGTIRSDGEIDTLINAAVTEVIDSFEEEMAERDKNLLKGFADEKPSNPVSRVAYLLRMRDVPGASDRMVGYLNQILQTLRQKLTNEERELFKGWGRGQNLLNDIS